MRKVKVQYMLEGDEFFIDHCFEAELTRIGEKFIWGYKKYKVIDLLHDFDNSIVYCYIEKVID